MQTTVHKAKTSLSRLIAKAEAGEEVIICRGTTPVAKIVPYVPSRKRRPKVGVITSKPITYANDCFAPLTDKEMVEMGFA